jgi:hypothetical protein
MRNSIAATALLLSAPLAWGISASPTAPDYESLYQRISESAFVVRATLAQMEIRPLRVDPPDLLGKPGYEGLELVNKGAVLYTITIKEMLCRHSDWSPSEPGLKQIQGPVYILAPRTEPPFQKNAVYSNRFDVKEEFSPGTEYLLFLREDPRQAELGKIYEVDPNETYYRAYWGESGAVELPSPQKKGAPRDFVTPLLTAVTDMCKAVQQPEPLVKRSELMQLRFLAAPGWRPELEKAIKAMEDLIDKR